MAERKRKQKNRWQSGPVMKETLSLSEITWAETFFSWENWQPILLDPREITCFFFHLPTHVGKEPHLSRVDTGINRRVTKRTNRGEEWERERMRKRESRERERERERRERARWPEREDRSYRSMSLSRSFRLSPVSLVFLDSSSLRESRSTLLPSLFPPPPRHSNSRWHLCFFFGKKFITNTRVSLNNITIHYYAIYLSQLCLHVVKNLICLNTLFYGSYHPMKVFQTSHLNG